MASTYIQGKESIDSPGYDGDITLDSTSLVDMDTTHTQGSVVSITNTPASAGNPNILYIDNGSTPFSSGNNVDIDCDDADTVPIITDQAANNATHISIAVAGTTYSTFGIGSSDQLLIQSTNNDNIQFLPDSTGTGITIFGSNTATTAGLDNDDCLVSGSLEVDGTIYAGDYVIFSPGDVQRYLLTRTLGFEFINLAGTLIAANATAGEIYIQAGNNVAWGRFQWGTSLVTTKIEGSANSIASDTNGYLCCYKYDANNIAVRNRLGATYKIAFTYQHYVV